MWKLLNHSLLLRPTCSDSDCRSRQGSRVRIQVRPLNFVEIDYIFFFLPTAILPTSIASRRAFNSFVCLPTASSVVVCPWIAINLVLLSLDVLWICYFLSIKMCFRFVFFYLLNVESNIFFSSDRQINIGQSPEFAAINKSRKSVTDERKIIKWLCRQKWKNKKK